MPPKQWRFPVMIISGVMLGIIFFLFYVSKAHSYLSDNPRACVNCHVMAPQYATWSHSSHREVANCNDCHVPHENVVKKYYFKAKDGVRHATMFTLKLEPQVIFIKEDGAEVVHNNCIRCHTNQITDPKLAATVKYYKEHTEGRKCWDCHREVPHGRVNSLSSVPNAWVPLPESPVPAWLKEFSKNNKK
ncbi:Cytochrome c nitrite reductase, small subunit NrfH [hydrothermal vent metagenome]|uniref:Cytochrome c nitrite reductase, small subunit NrfH n=1 Tax=hydrothermal vent metagenome TaxID=652676 RepID=A0A3B0TVB7_9ZZZZ